MGKSPKRTIKKEVIDDDDSEENRAMVEDALRMIAEQKEARMATSMGSFRESSSRRA